MLELHHNDFTGGFGSEEDVEEIKTRYRRGFAIEAAKHQRAPKNACQKKCTVTFRKFSGLTEVVLEKSQSGDRIVVMVIQTSGKLGGGNVC